MACCEAFADQNRIIGALEIPNPSMTQVTFDPSPTGDIPMPNRSESRTRLGGRSVRWFWVIVGWPALAVVLVGLALRWQDPYRPLVIALIGLTPFLGFPLFVGVFSAWLSRSNTLRAVAAVMTAAFVFTVSPVDAVIGCGAETAPDSLTIYSANVLAHGGRSSDIASSIIAEDPDVVAMQEVRWAVMTELRADPRLAEYRYWSNETMGMPVGELIFSRYPLEDVQVRPLHSGGLVTATVVSESGPFVLSSVHTQAPAEADNVRGWHRQLDQLANLDKSEPAILAGDFNATSDHQPFRTVLNSGWTDVHDEKGCGFDTTWPIDDRVPFPVYRLDHVLVTDHFEVLDVRFGDPAGSDHVPVITSVRLS